MKLSQQLKDFLEKRHVNYEVISHEPRFTAQQTAAAAHVSGKKVAKPVVVRADGKETMTVIPAHQRLDLSTLRDVLGADEVEVESENEIGRLFPDSELGAMPPLGAIYQMPCYVDARLTENDVIVFNAGSHEQSIKLATPDYLKLAEAVVADLTET